MQRQYTQRGPPDGAAAAIGRASHPGPACPGAPRYRAGGGSAVSGAGSALVGLGVVARFFRIELLRAVATRLFGLAGLVRILASGLASGFVDFAGLHELLLVLVVAPRGLPIAFTLVLAAFAGSSCLPSSLTSFSWKPVKGMAYARARRERPAARAAGPPPRARGIVAEHDVPLFRPTGGRHQPIPTRRPGDGLRFPWWHRIVGMPRQREMRTKATLLHGKRQAVKRCRQRRVQRRELRRYRRGLHHREPAWPYSRLVEHQVERRARDREPVGHRGDALDGHAADVVQGHMPVLRRHAAARARQ